MYNILKTKLFLFKGFFAHFVLSAAKKRRQPDAMINLCLLFMWLIKHMLDLLSSVLHFSWRTFKGVFVMKEIDRVARGEKLLFDHSTRVASCNTFPPMNAVIHYIDPVKKHRKSFLANAYFEVMKKFAYYKSQIWNQFRNAGPRERL